MRGRRDARELDRRSPRDTASGRGWRSPADGSREPRFITAAFVVGAVTLVEQAESDLLQPVVMSRAVKLHPVATLLAVTAGTVIWGIIGAFLAVPLTAAAAASASPAVRLLHHRHSARPP